VGVERTMRPGKLLGRSGPCGGKNGSPSYWNIKRVFFVTDLLSACGTPNLTLDGVAALKCSRKRIGKFGVANRHGEKTILVTARHRLSFPFGGLSKGGRGFYSLTGRLTHENCGETKVMETGETVPRPRGLGS